MFSQKWYSKSLSRSKTPGINADDDDDGHACTRCRLLGRNRMSNREICCNCPQAPNASVRALGQNRSLTRSLGVTWRPHTGEHTPDTDPSRNSPYWPLCCTVAASACWGGEVAQERPRSLAHCRAANCMLPRCTQERCYSIEACCRRPRRKAD